MFGYLRFLLAFIVMLSHIDIRLYGLNPGVIAVVIFYILAGYVVSHLFRDIYFPTSSLRTVPPRHCEEAKLFFPSLRGGKADAAISLPPRHCEPSFPVIARSKATRQSPFLPVIATSKTFLSVIATSKTFLSVIASEARQSKNALFAFYKDRFLRIFPLYTSVLLLTLAFLLLTSFATPTYSLPKLLNNMAIIPLNYYMYIDGTILTNPSWWLIPPAWSLGTELQAYLLLPFALMYRRVFFTAVLISFGIYTLANFSVIHPDYFGYRFIAGVLFIFLAGSALQRYEKSDKLYIAVLWMLIAALALFAYYTNSFSSAYTKETYAGLLIGIPLVLFLSKTKITLPFNKTLGNLSYAIFLTHFLSIWILQYIGIPSSKTFAYISQLSLLTFFISAVLTQIPLSPKRSNPKH